MGMEKERKIEAESKHIEALIKAHYCKLKGVKKKVKIVRHVIKVPLIFTCIAICVTKRFGFDCVDVATMLIF